MAVNPLVWDPTIWLDLEDSSHYVVEGDEEQDDYHGKQNVAPEVVAALKDLKAGVQHVWNNNQQ